MCIRKTRLGGTERCQLEFVNDTLNGFCPPAWDSFLCWPPTPPEELRFLPCPEIKGNDVSKFAFRKCMENGTWSQRPGSEGDNPIGWTNYSLCFNPYIKTFMEKIQGTQSNLSRSDYQMKHDIAEKIRVLEMAGLTLSIVALLVSLVIFYRFRNLQNNRTQIHKNLFIAMSIQVAVRLSLYIDQYLSKISNSEFYTIETTKYACEASYILLEYAKTAMFLWMFNEGLYLHNTINVAVFHERLNLITFYMIGWGFPVLLVMAWGSLTSYAFYGYFCWSGYNFSGLFWVLEGPRLAVILLNLLFLLNIIRVLVTKMRESYSTEAQQVRKAVKAAIVLLPLLGITNAIQMLHSPADKSIIQFAIWSYVTTFLSSFQGFLCAFIYCFLNGEVQLSLKRFFRARKRSANMQSHRNRREPIAMNEQVRDKGCEHIQEQVKHDRNAQTKGFGPERQEQHNQSGKLNRKLVGDIAIAIRKEGFFENSSDGHVDIEHIEIPFEYFTQPTKKKTNSAATSCTVKVLTISPTDLLTVPPICKTIYKESTSINSKSVSKMTSGSDAGDDK